LKKRKQRPDIKAVGLISILRTIDISWMLRPRSIETINEIIVHKNYYYDKWINETQEAERRQKPRKQYEIQRATRTKKANKMRTGYTILNTASNYDKIIEVINLKKQISSKLGWVLTASPID
jgi:predicted transposase YbfD/YdcC